MRTIEFLNTAVEGAGALGRIEFDPFLAALASLKTTDGKALVTNWINPEPAMSIVDGDVLKLRDAANASILNGLPGSAVAIRKNFAINGRATLTASNATALVEGTVNAKEWTLLAVCNLQNTNTNQRIFGLGGGTLAAGSLWPVLEVSANGSLTVREGGTTERRVIVQPSEMIGVPVILAATFSVEQGIAAFKNNLARLARNADDKRVLTTPNFSFLGDRGATNYALGSFGMSLALRGDITKPEYSAAREIILGGLMGRYGIT